MIGLLRFEKASFLVSVTFSFSNFIVILTEQIIKVIFFTSFLAFESALNCRDYAGTTIDMFKGLMMASSSAGRSSLFRCNYKCSEVGDVYN